MLAEMPVWLFEEWRVFAQFEPLSTARRLEGMLGHLMALMVNMRLPKEKRRVAGKDFVPDYGPPKKVRPVDGKTLYAAFRSWAVGAGAAVKR